MPRPDRNNPQAPRMVRARVRDRLALRLRCAGKPYHEIAKAIGVKTTGAAHKCVSRALQRVEVDLRQAASRLRAQEVARLDELTKAIWEQAVGIKDDLGVEVTKPDLRAVDRVIEIMRRRAQLLGLDVSKLELTGAGGGPIDIRSEREQVAGLLDRIHAGIKAVEGAGKPN